MNIRARMLLLVSFLLAFAIIAVITGLSIMKSNNTDLKHLYVDRIVPLEDLKKIADAYAVNIVDTNHQLRNGNLTWQQAKDNILSAQSDIQRLWSGYMNTTLTDEEAKLADKAQSLMSFADQQSQQLLAMIDNRDQQGITQFSIDKLYPAIDPISGVISELINLQLRESKKINDTSNESYETMLWLATTLAILILIVAILLSRITLIAITRPLNNLVNTAQQVQNTGDLSLRATVTRNDEIGQVSSAFNHLLEAVSKGIEDANRVVSAIAKSDFKQRITNDYQGDLNNLKQGINNSAESVAFMMSELEKIMTALSQGRFDAKMDKDVPDAFRQQVESALDSIFDIVEDINQVMEKINQGEFDARVSSAASGQMDSLKQNINRSMDALENAIEDTVFNIEAIASGDLTHSITNDYQGQLLRLKNSINQSNQRLSEVVTKALNATSVVNGAASEVSQGSMNLSQRVQENAAAAEQTSATMEEMSSAVTNNTQHAKEATSVAHEVQQKSNEGVQVMQQTIEAMNAIQESSHKISDIVSLIDGIAFQTNLLALNAAVEAARAGDHGRGFAVVAGEVRSLAQKAADAAKDITNLINESVTRIDDGTKLATASGEMLTTISESVDNVTNMIEQIAEASSQQMAGIQQANAAITQIDEGTQQNAALVEETSAAAESLSEQARILQEDMAFFTVNASGNKGSTRLAAPKAVAKAPTQPKSSPALPSKLAPTSDKDDEWDDF
ncbi:methyl-accepting chemotaxis protein [Hydrogenovibrio sp. SC-1]|uniref:HAMP domain-containing methyl-accepting chemotaxis protein n=1 Tax=Hydrogenovibrio sp. SC-1 TaxID=2065820 RepID=UPI000C7B77DA|nr:methyl-accepting chemotaxis protein [Hydrogenovibrio sp. SC-1]PLA73652.1 methyl-accepting chemotaxis protein [Hydrogenovibrio sp. SC-1]